MSKNAQPTPPRPARRFVEKLRQIVAERDQSMGAASLSIGAAYSALGQYGSYRFDRPTPEILSAIVAAWPATQSIPLVVAHLNDEIYRSGLDPDAFTVAHHSDSIDRSSDAAAVFRAANASTGWADLLSALAVLARRDAKLGYPAGSSMQSEIAKVAEADPGAVKFAMDKPSIASYDPPVKSRKRKETP